MKNKKLTDDDLKLWAQVVNTIETPLKEIINKEKNLNSKNKTKSVNRKSVENSDHNYENNLISTKLLKQKNDNNNIDKRVLSKLKAGKLKPEEILDLHGYTLIKAKKPVPQFVLQAYEKKKRLILIITGKGKLSSDWGTGFEKKGVLRKEVPNLLKDSPLGEIVLSVTVSNVRHGGSGALYVYLRRNRTLR